MTGCLSCSAANKGYLCTGNDGQLSSCKTICGDNIKTIYEQCDNGNKTGCSKNCILDLGYYWDSALSAAVTRCGDRIVAGT